MARALSKSKLMSFLKCPKRLWLEAHRLELPRDARGILPGARSAAVRATRARLAEGAAEAIDPGTSRARRAEIRARLLRYCAYDTLATVRIARFLENSTQSRMRQP